MRRSRENSPRYRKPNAAREDKLRFIPPEVNGHRQAPKAFVPLYILCIVLGGLGDWDRLAGGIGTYMKAFAAGAVVLALLTFLITGSYHRLKRLYSFAVLFFIPILFTLLMSLLIWALKMESLSAISRGSQKLIFQCINILSVLSAVYMFGNKALLYFCIGLVGANTAIALLTMKDFGVGASIQSVIDGLLHGGEAHGFMLKMEIHDITFAMGLLAFYFLTVQWKEKESIPWLLATLFYFVLGYKRIAFLGFGFGLVLWVLLERRKIKTRVLSVYAVSVLLALFCFAYVCFIKSGLFVTTMNALGINVMGRDRIYTYINNFYEIDVGYLGYGFEYVVAMLRGMKAEGTQVIHVTGMHNDILKQYIEMGFWGFWFWVFFIYVYQIRWHMRYYGEKAARLMLCANLYTIVTYMTDNTLYYFWLSMTLRMIMVGYAFSPEVTVALNREQGERGFVSAEQIARFADDGFK